MASQGQIELFDSRKDEWDSWSRRFDQWLSISPYETGDDADNKKRAASLVLKLLSYSVPFARRRSQRNAPMWN